MNEKMKIKEMFLTGFGYDSSLKIKPNTDFDKKSEKKTK
jgi:hypothetical protein